VEKVRPRKCRRARCFRSTLGDGRGEEATTQITGIRYVAEQGIANFKTWRITHTDYRRPIETSSKTISTVIALHFCVVS
jgi:hypothetical protein